MHIFYLRWNPADKFTVICFSVLLTKTSSFSQSIRVTAMRSKQRVKYTEERLHWVALNTHRWRFGGNWPAKIRRGMLVVTYLGNEKEDFPLPENLA